MSTLGDYKLGERVMFGRDSGEKTLGEVVKINRSKLKIRQLESRGTFKSHAIGTIWTVPPSLCAKTDASCGTSAPAGFVVTSAESLDRKTVANGFPNTPVRARPEVEIMRDVARIYSRLSPESLSCDGELPRSQVARRAAALRRELRDCFRELGREVSESEAFEVTHPGRKDGAW